MHMFSLHSELNLGLSLYNKVSIYTIFKMQAQRLISVDIIMKSYSIATILYVNFLRTPLQSDATDVMLPVPPSLAGGQHTLQAQLRNSAKVT